MKQKRMSLAFKLNLLLSLIVLVVSLVLAKGSYDAYTRTVYQAYYEKLNFVERMAVEKDRSLYDKIVWSIRAIRLEGFAEKQQLAQKEQDDWRLFEWLNDFVIVEGSDEFIHQAEYDENGTPNNTGYLDSATAIFYNVSYLLQDLAKQADIYSVTLISELTPGQYVQIIHTSTAYNFNEFSMGLEYGRELAEPEPIAVYNAQKKHEDFRLDTDAGNGLFRVVPVEHKGERFYLIYSCDVTDARQGQKAFLLQSLLFVALMVAVAIGLSLFLLRRMAIKPLRSLAAAATAFAAGDRAYRREDVVDLPIRSTDEIGDLYREIRSMQTRIIDNAENLTRMTAEKERISMELDLATKIQAHMLPSSFPAFPDRTEFDVYASMNPAKEVGGDFYDFFLLDDDHLALVIADVSGKGVPAALFMMVSKILVKNYAMTGLSPAGVLEAVNHQICSNNPEQMFVTIWMGILELSTGRLTAANGGHEYPLLKQPGSAFAVYKDKHGFIIGGMDGMKYKDYELALQPGARLFVYTDGVPEATDAKNELFGLTRTLQALNQDGGDPRTDLERVHSAVNAFVGDAEQFDDITMLCLEYRGPAEEKRKTLPSDELR